MRDEIQQLEAYLAQTLTYQERITTLNTLARKLRHRDPQYSLTLSQKAQKLATQEAYPEGIADSLHSCGQIYYQLGRYNLAQAAFSQALSLFEEVENNLAQADVWNGMGLIQWRLADYAEATANHHHALNLFRKVGSKDGEGRALGNLGMVYGVTGAYEQAFDMFQQAVAIFEAIPHQEGVGFALNNMALAYLWEGNMDEALSYAQSSLKIARTIDNVTLELNVLDTTGDIYLARGEGAEAIVYFRQSIMLADVVGKQHGKLTAMLNIGRAYMQQKKFELGLVAWQDALDLANRLEAKEEQRQCYQGMAQLYKQFNDFERALACHEQFHKLDRDIFDETADLRLKTLHVIHNTNRLQKEAEVTHLQNVTLEREISRRKQMEEALRESERNLFRAHQMAQLGSFYHNLLTKELVWSGELCRIFGIGEEDRQMTVEEVSQLIHPDDLPKLLQATQSLVEGRARSVALDVRGMHASGDMHYYHDRYEAVYDEHGKAVRIFGTVQDVTERKQAEELLRQAQKMESLGVLAGGVAHDFNNLLVAMLGQTSLALEKMRAESPARSHVEKAVNAAKRAADLTQQMLAYSGRGHFEVRPLNLNALIEENLHLFASSVAKNVNLQSELADNLPLIDADMGQMQQVVMNLIINGAEAIGDGLGRVLVITDVEEVVEDDGRFQQFTATQLMPGRYVTLEVHDNGKGMDSNTLAKVFDPFFSTKQTGHGLGLAAVSGIIRGHNGGIRVYSEVGQGTTFKLLFPVSEASPVEAVAETAVFINTPISTLVLIIDDEAPVREAITDILALENIDVIAAADGTKGLALYQKRMADIGLIILDLSMPGISGEETFRRLRRINPNVQVLLSSGYNQVEATRRFSGKGLVGFMQKPYNAATLIREVKDYLYASSS